MNLGTEVSYNSTTPLEVEHSTQNLKQHLWRKMFSHTQHITHTTHTTHTAHTTHTTHAKHATHVTYATHTTYYNTPNRRYAPQHATHTHTHTHTYAHSSCTCETDMAKFRTQLQRHGACTLAQSMHVGGLCLRKLASSPLLGALKLYVMNIRINTAEHKLKFVRQALHMHSLGDFAFDFQHHFKRFA